MTGPTIRAVQRGLLAVVAAIVLAVVWNLRRSAPTPAPTATPDVARQPGTQHTLGFHYEQKKYDKETGKDRLAFTLDAESMVGQEQEDVALKGVTMTFPYLAEGQQGKATITSDDCTYTPNSQKAVFQGHVVVRTEDGGELTTDSLVYRGDKGFARTEAPAQFKRGALSGTSTGMVYDADAGEVRLLADAFVSMEDEKGGPPLEVRSQRAVAKREEGTLSFEEDVTAHKGDDTLTASEQVLVIFDTSDQKLVGVSAVGDVVLNTPGGKAIPGIGPAQGGGGGKGPRILKGKRLDVSFRHGQTPESAAAGPDAELTILPGPGEAPERRRLSAKVLTFHFDEDGRLTEVSGQRDTSFVTEAIPPAKALPRSIACRSFVASIDPATSETKNIDFQGDVEMTRGTQKSKSERARYGSRKKLLTLEGQPEIFDTEDGGRLQAKGIDIGTESGNLSAHGDVSHVLGKGVTQRKGMLGKGAADGGQDEAPTVITCKVFSYEAAARQTRYMEGALLRSGKDEIRAPTIRLKEDRAGTGSRRLWAGDNVVTLFHPQEKPGQKAPLPVDTRAKELLYDEAQHEAVYTGDVVIHQGDIVSKSPEARVTFSQDGNQIQTVVAGEPVEIQQGPRKASGRQATYTPSIETLLLVGDKVLLEQPGQQVTGRSLTFHVGGDRILIDGREEVRTETILKKEPPKP